MSSFLALKLRLTMKKHRTKDNWSVGLSPILFSLNAMIRISDAFGPVQLQAVGVDINSNGIGILSR